MKRLFSILAFLWAFACVAAVPAVIVDQGKSPPPFDGINLPAMVIQAPATVLNSMTVINVQPVIFNCMQVYDSFIPACATVPDVEFVLLFEGCYSQLLLIKPPGMLSKWQFNFRPDKLLPAVVETCARDLLIRGSNAPAGNFCSHILTTSSIPFY